MKKANKSKKRNHLPLKPRQSRIKAFQKHNPNKLSHQNPAFKSLNSNNTKSSENDLTMILQSIPVC
jgi:hypothetical protein